ncbi:MAG: peptide ABC transporter substrate-binding protein [bacterium]|nr:peptide ABC transporter substrate-binding protein [bacterium]
MRNPLSFLIPIRRKLTARFTHRSTSAPAVSVDADHALVQNLNDSRWPTWTQFSYIFRYLGKREGVLFRIAIVLLFTSAAILVIRYIGRHWIPEPTIGGNHTEAIVGSPRFLNPALASSDVDMSLTPLVYSGLLRLAADGTYVNDLAAELTVSNDGKTYTAKLKPGLQWHDGEKLTADDVRFTFEMLQDPNVASPRYTTVRGVKVDAPDDNTITFALEKVDPTFQSVLAVGILPAHIWSDIPPSALSTTDFNLKPIGSGPFKFKEIRKKGKTGGVTSIALERFSNTPTPARLKDLQLRFVDDADASIDALSNGQADGLRLVSTEQMAKAEKLRGTKTVVQPLPQVVAVYFNVKNALFARREVRLALRAAADQAQVIERARPQAPATNGALLPGMPGAANNPPTARTQDLDAAAKLLTDAGWAKDGSVYARKGQKLSFTLAVPDVKEYTDAASALAEQWTAFGAEVKVQAVDTSVINKEMIKGRTFDTILYSDRYDGTFDLYPFWHSTQSFDPGLNLTSYYNKDLDKLLTDARQLTVNPQAKAEAYQKADTILMADAPAIFLYQSFALIVQKDNLRSTTPLSLLEATNRFLDVTDWYVKTNRVWHWNP